MFGAKEIQYLKKAFAEFGCASGDIQEVKVHDLLTSFAVNSHTSGESIEVPTYECNCFNVGEHPHFCIVSKKGETVQLDFCMELSFVLDYVAELYFKEDFDLLGVYFQHTNYQSSYPVEFGAIVHLITDDEDEFVAVENFGAVKGGKTINRAVVGEKSDLPLREYFSAKSEEATIRVELFHLNNVIDLRLEKAGYATYADAYRFATSVAKLEDYMEVLKAEDVTFKPVIYASEVVGSTRVIAREFEQGKSRWKKIYEEGLTK